MNRGPAARRFTLVRALRRASHLGSGLGIRVTREVLWVWGALLAALLLAGLGRLQAA